jgi:hypothetical protein
MLRFRFIWLSHFKGEDFLEIDQSETRIAILAEQCPNLETIDLSGMAVTDISLRSLGKKCMKLKVYLLYFLYLLLYDSKNTLTHSKARQMSKIQWVQHITVSNTL